MKYFFGCTFMSKNELANIGVKYPIKLDYYKTKEEDEKSIKYGIEIVKTSYIEETTKIEKKTIPNIIKDELKVETILEKLKKNKVTPISVEDIIEDFLKVNC